MKTIIPAFACAAVLALAGPAFAGKSTPQERETTKQLNLEAAQQAQTTNQQIAAASANMATPAQSAPAAAPTMPVESAPAAEQASRPAASPPDAGNAGANPPAQ